MRIGGLKLFLKEALVLDGLNSKVFLKLAAKRSKRSFYKWVWVSNAQTICKVEKILKGSLDLIP